MDLLKQLETKVQTLVQQRQSLKEELDKLKAADAVGSKELQALRAELDAVSAENAALKADREAVKDQVASILRALEALG